MVDKVMFSSKRDDWLTPREIIDASIEAMGAIDLDPCAETHDDPNVPAGCHYTEEDDGLDRKNPWFGRVYMNPPYGRIIGLFCDRLDEEVAAGNVTQAIALVPSRTDTRWWRTLTRNASAICFIKGRLRFGGAPSSAPFPSAVIAYGIPPEKLLEVFGEMGQVCAIVGGV